MFSIYLRRPEATLVRRDALPDGVRRRRPRLSTVRPRVPRRRPRVRRRRAACRAERPDHSHRTRECVIVCYSVL